MSAKAFFDTNVLIYAFAQDDPRAEVAADLLAGGGAISVQVLNEFTAVARRKLGMPWDEVLDALAAIRSLCAPPLPLKVETHEAALRIAQERGYGIHDSLVIASALEAGCDTLYSEDMQHGQLVDGLTICNPFSD